MLKLFLAAVNFTLKGHCHEDIFVCLPKQLKYLTKNPFFSVKSLLEQREENMNFFSPGKNKLESISLKFVIGTCKKIIFMSPSIQISLFYFFFAIQSNNKNR